MFMPDVKIKENEGIFFSIQLLHPLDDKQLAIIKQEITSFLNVQMLSASSIQIIHGADPAGRYWLSFSIELKGFHFDAFDISAMGILVNEIMQLKLSGYLKLLKALLNIEQWAVNVDESDEGIILAEVLKLPNFLLNAIYPITTANSFDVMVHMFKNIANRSVNNIEEEKIKEAVVAAKCSR